MSTADDGPVRSRSQTDGCGDRAAVRYNGPACTECGRPTVTAQIAAPGYGRVRVCEAGHDEELGPCGIFTLEDVR